MKRKLLIATTNQGKFREISAFLETLPLEIIGLSDLPSPINEPDETEATLEGNALRKARHYGEASGLLTLSEDTGIFIPALDNWPGIKSARIATSSEARNNLVIEKLKPYSGPDRRALFKVSAALFDPLTNSSHSTYGEVTGEIVPETGLPKHDYAYDPKQGHGYDPIFYLPEIQKTYSQLSLTEKNGVSHRGKALIKMKYHLQNTYATKHIVVPYALIIKDGKVLMSLRSEPHRPQYHLKWEFPGGTVEFGETIRENVVREVKEEVGYDVEAIKLLQHVATEAQEYPTHQYQVYLIPYVCRILGGDGVYSDGEVVETRWVAPDDILGYDMIGNNAAMCREILPELKQVIKDYQL